MKPKQHPPFFSMRNLDKFKIVEITDVYVIEVKTVLLVPKDTPLPRPDDPLYFTHF